MARRCRVLPFARHSARSLKLADNDPENGCGRMGWRAGDRNLSRALVQGEVWRALAAVGGRDTVTLKL
jgi:hypothetical protein